MTAGQISLARPRGGPGLGDSQNRVRRQGDRPPRSGLRTPPPADGLRTAPFCGPHFCVPPPLAAGRLLWRRHHHRLTSATFSARIRGPGLNARRHVGSRPGPLRFGVMVDALTRSSPAGAPAEARAVRRVGVCDGGGAWPSSAWAAFIIGHRQLDGPIVKPSVAPAPANRPRRTVQRGSLPARPAREHARERAAWCSTHVHRPCAWQAGLVHWLLATGSPRR